jgi:hypothetical protein
VQLLVVDGPQEMEAFLDACRAQSYGARMPADYCWHCSRIPSPVPVSTPMVLCSETTGHFSTAGRVTVVFAAS